MATVNTVTPNRREFTLEGRLGKLIARGAKLRQGLADQVLDGTIDLSTDEVTQLTLTIHDPDLELLDSGLFWPGTETKAGSRLDYGDDLRLEVAAVEVNDNNGTPSLVVTARSLGAQRLRRARGALIRKKITPTEFAHLEARNVGLDFVGQPSAQRFAISRQTGTPGDGGDTGETSWDTLQRLASELGYLCFEAAGVLYFGKPTWLVEHTGRVLEVAWKKRPDERLLNLPLCRRTSDDAKKLATVSANLGGTLGDDVRTGHRLNLSGVPKFTGRYLITGVRIPLDDSQPVTVDAATPVNPDPQPPATVGKPGSSDGTTSTGGGKGTAAAFVSYALAQAGDTYIYGAETTASDPDPNAFDCSELVQWAAGRAGVAFVDGSSAQIAACRPVSVDTAIQTRGALLWAPGHVAISLGNGRTIEAANSRVGVVSYPAAGRFSRGGLIPGLAY